MRYFLWNGPGEYDRFVRVDEKEMKAIVDHYGNPRAVGFDWGDGNYFYLVNDEKRVVTPLLMPSLAFGGQWNSDSPYGGEITCHFSLDTLDEYRLDMDWSTPK